MNTIINFVFGTVIIIAWCWYLLSCFSFIRGEGLNFPGRYGSGPYTARGMSAFLGLSLWGIGLLMSSYLVATKWFPNDAFFKHKELVILMGCAFLIPTGIIFIIAVEKNKK